ncbi:MAG: helix-turn-helix transcriptional regulator [Lentisphaerae bacterium]|nr:helix-turn-helix transcriptional regulator [Lentisphaerota bacterium]
MSDVTATIPGSDGSESLLAVLRPYARHCGDADRPAWHIGRRCLLDYMLVYIAKGRMKLTIGEEVHEVHGGDLFWIPPDTPHEMRGYAPGTRLAFVHFDLVYDGARSHWDFSIPSGMVDMGELLPLMHPPMDHPGLLGLKGVLRGHTNARAGRLLQDLCTEAARAQPLAGLRMSGLLIEIVAELLRGQIVREGGWTAHVPALERVAAELAARCGEPLQLAELARKHGFSASYLRDLFARHYGCGPRTYLRQARIRQARSLMMGTSLTLSEIALRVGFESIHSFSRAFKAVERSTPSDYRRAGRPSTRVGGRATPYPH